jgi:hypothetical protein
VNAPRERLTWWSLGLWLCLLAGTALVAVAYAYAERHDDGAKHHLFWAGMLAFMLPAAVRLAMARTPRIERLAILVAIGLFSYLPKYLRNPDFPLFHDEFAHWRQAEQVHDQGRAFLESPIISLLEDFPGLHTLTTMLRNLAGLSTFDAGTVLLALGHVLLLLATFIVAERLSGSARVGGVAALVYSVSPGFAFFHSQYAYESLAIVLVAWLLVALTLAHPERGRRRWLVAAVILGAASIPTHHLSSYVGIAVVVALALIATPLWAAAGVLTAAALVWAIVVAPHVGEYLAGPLSGGFEDVAGLFSPERATRAPFRGSIAPLYERASAFAAVAAVGLLTLLGLRALWRTRPRRALPIVLALVGVLYFPSLLFNLTERGGEAAHRSWAFSYLGLAVLIAPVAVALLARRRAWAPVLAVAFVFGLVGNLAADVNVYYRFPGEFVYGSDTRSTTPELLSVATRFQSLYGKDVPVVSDRYVALPWASAGKARTALNSPSFPIWEMYFKPGKPQPSLLDQLNPTWRFMVGDTRMTSELPFVGGVQFEINEPITGKLPPADLYETYDHLPWAPKVMASDHVNVYRLDYGVLGLTTVEQQEAGQ